MDFTIKNKIELMRECHITPNEHELIIGILMAQDEEFYHDEEYRTEHQCPSHVPDTSYLIFLQQTLGKVNLRTLLLELQEKGLILKSCKLPDPNGNEGIKPNDIAFNKNILKKYVRHSGILFWELFWAYPESMYINGRHVSLRSTFGQGGWASLDEAASFYGQRIKYNAKTHAQILDIVEQAKEQGLLNMGLIKFLRGEEWITLEKTLSGEGNSNMNSDVKFV